VISSLWLEVFEKAPEHVKSAKPAMRGYQPNRDETQIKNLSRSSTTGSPPDEISCQSFLLGAEVLLQIDVAEYKRRMTVTNIVLRGPAAILKAL